MPYTMSCQQLQSSQRIRTTLETIIVLCLFILITLPPNIHAFPNGAGDCPEGKPAVEGVHIWATSLTTGSLEESGFHLEISGRVAQPLVSVELQQGVEHAWYLVADNGQFFRGFLLRLGGNADTTVALSSANADVNEALAVCVMDQGVGGVTHADSAEKREVSGILRLDEVAKNLPLDVTVVVENRNGSSEYYYTQYTLEFVDFPRFKSASTTSQTAAPSAAVPALNYWDILDSSPGTSPPSSRPLANPQLAPTQAPQENISNSPTRQPTIVDSPTQQSIIVDSPTQQPTGVGSPTEQPPTLLPTDSITETAEPTIRPTSYNWNAGNVPPTGAPTIVESESGDSTPDDNNGTIPRPVLVDVDPDCSSANPCAECYGDCDHDDQCQDGLACYRRPGDDTSPVPGCEGKGSPGADYCYKPSLSILRLRSSPCTSDRPCSRCEGDCDKDSHCKDGLICFKRTYPDYTEVPGCEGVGITGLDYCYDSKDESPVATDTVTLEADVDACMTDADCFQCGEEPCLYTAKCYNQQCVSVEKCGAIDCAVGEYCCNPSCSMCASNGETCSEHVCAPCGDVVCDPGDLCCHPECGICTHHGDFCPMQCDITDGETPTYEACEEEIDCPPLSCPNEPCLQFVCRDERCVLVEVCGDNQCDMDFEYCCDLDCGGACTPFGAECPNPCDESITVVVEGNVTDGGSGNEFGMAGPEDATSLARTSLISCEDDSDCPDFLCLDEPCPVMECRESQCLLHYPCGNDKCIDGDICCCGRCQPQGGSCNDVAGCTPCGQTMCPEPEVCCNESCGICALPGQDCIKTFCFDEGNE